MIKIAICDDKKSCINEIYQYLKTILKNQEVKYTAFLSGTKLLESEEKFDIIFLDIEMPGMDGIEVGKRIRLKNEKCKIIMVTTLKERFKDAFHFQAFRYVTKPIEKNELEEAILSAIDIPLGEQYMHLYLNRIEYSIQQKDIKYVRAYNGYTEFYVAEKVFRREESLSTIIKELDSKLFFQINRQYIVNLKEIDRIDGVALYVGSDILKVSTRIKKEFEKVYMEFDLNFGSQF